MAGQTRRCALLRVVRLCTGMTVKQLPRNAFAAAASAKTSCGRRSLLAARAPSVTSEAMMNRRRGPRGPKTSDWRSGRASDRWLGAAQPQRSLLCTRAPAARLRAWRVTGGQSGRRHTERSDLQAGQLAKRAPFMRNVKASGPAIPRHGNGLRRASAGNAGLDVFE
jgi:hypothetical protein